MGSTQTLSSPVLYLLSYQANWELVIIWVYDETVESGYVLINEISFVLPMETILMFMIFRSYVMLLEQKRNKDLQNTGLNGNSNPDLYDDGAMLHQLRYQAN